MLRIEEVHSFLPKIEMGKTPEELTIKITTTASTIELLLSMDYSGHLKDYKPIKTPHRHRFTDHFWDLQTETPAVTREWLVDKEDQVGSIRVM